MKFLILIASVVALASASPASRVYHPRSAPAPEPISIGPALVEPQEPTPILPEEEEITAPVAPAPEPEAPLVTIVITVNSAGQVVVGPPEAEPVNVVDYVPSPVPEPEEIGIPELPSPEFIPEPEVIGNPNLPNPGVVLPEELN